MATTMHHPQIPDTQQQRTHPSKPSGKLGSTFKKVGKYLRDQASEQSHSGLYLSPAARRQQQQQYIYRTDDGRELSQSQLDEELTRRLHAVNNSGQPPKYLAETLPPYTPIDTPRSSAAMSTSSASGPGIFQDMIRHQYASDNMLQSYDVLQPERSTSTPIPPSPDHSHWIVFIHGGYFRDPKVDSTALKPAISLIEEEPSLSALRPQISGYASLNYRLSPHPAHPQDPETTPQYTLNNARWPDHLNDILAALAHLQSRYPASRNYILAGHSVGATLAFLATLRCADMGLAAPKALLGVSGIYDFPSIHKSNPYYEPYTNGAIDRDHYVEASPALYGSDEYVAQWTPEEGHLRNILLAHSRDDGLVVWEQPEGMLVLLRGEEGLRAEMMELKGDHDGIWREGSELVRAIGRGLEMVG